MQNSLIKCKALLKAAALFSMVLGCVSTKATPEFEQLVQEYEILISNDYRVSVSEPTSQQGIEFINKTKQIIKVETFSPNQRFLLNSRSLMGISCSEKYIEVVITVQNLQEPLSLQCGQKITLWINKN